MSLYMGVITLPAWGKGRKSSGLVEFCRYGFGQSWNHSRENMKKEEEEMKGQEFVKEEKMKERPKKKEVKGQDFLETP